MVTSTLSHNKFSTGTPLVLFRKRLARGLMYRLWARLTRRRTRLLDLDDTLRDHPVESSHYAGVKPVLIDTIQGTQGKADEFDALFNPTRERSLGRWLDVARQKFRGRELPPVELIEINGIHYVRDGHHRISVSRAMGQNYIDAEVIVMQLRWQNMLR